MNKSVLMNLKHSKIRLLLFLNMMLRKKRQVAYSQYKLYKVWKTCKAIQYVA